MHFSAPAGRRLAIDQVAADHELDHALVPDLLPFQSAGVASIAQRHHAIRDFCNLAEPVGDIDDADALGAQILGNLEQGVRLAKRQARGRLIHEQDARVHRERLRYFHHLLVGDWQVAHARGRRHIDAKALHVFRGLRVDRAAVDQFQWARGERLAPEEDIPGYIDIIEDVELLVDKADPITRRVIDRADGDLRAIDEDGAFIGLVHASERLEQRRFSRPVLADERDDFAGINFEADLAKGEDTREALGYLPQFQQRRSALGWRCHLAFPEQIVELLAEVIDL